MDRRMFMKGTSVITAGAWTSAAPAHATEGRGRKTTFLFIHGAWHGAFCWNKILRRLTNQGFRALAIDLPGHGLGADFPASYFGSPQNLQALQAEPSPLAALSLDNYADAAIKTVKQLSDDGPVVVVGHSLGGLTLNRLGETIPEHIKRLVYLAAFCPIVLHSALEYLAEPEFATGLVPRLFIGDPAQIGALRINHNSADPSYRGLSKAAFYGDVSDTAFNAVGNCLTPDEPVAVFVGNAQVTAERWGRVRRTFIRCTEDQAIPIAMQDRFIAEANLLTGRGRRRFDVKTLESSHSPFVSQPRELTEILGSLA